MIVNYRITVLTDIQGNKFVSVSMDDGFYATGLVDKDGKPFIFDTDVNPITDLFDNEIDIKFHNMQFDTDPPDDAQRSIAQNRLYQAWMHDMSRTRNNKYAGHSNEYWKDFMKRRFLMVIFERDDDSYAETVQSVRNLRNIEGALSEFELISKFVIKETSTTKCSVKQFTEYLTEISNWAGTHGIALRTDHPSLKEAMGYK